MTTAKEENEWTSCLDLLDFNVYCCRHDFSSREMPPRVQKAIRICSLISLLLTFTQIVIGGYVSNFFVLPYGAVRLGCWWVGLLWLSASICGLVCRTRGWIMACMVLALIGIPIGIGGAASDSNGYYRYTEPPPLGCAQISVKIPPLLGGSSSSQSSGHPDSPFVFSLRQRKLQVLPALSSSPTLSPVSGGAAPPSSLVSPSSSRSPTRKPVALPRITSYGPSAVTASLARDCLDAQVKKGGVSSISSAACYCTVPNGAESTNPDKLQCQVLQLGDFVEEGGCAAIFDSWLPSLKAR